MDRRTFLKAAAALVALSSGLGVAAWLGRRSRPGKGFVLPAELASLHDPRFAEAAARFDAESLYAELRDLGVLTDDGLDHTTLAKVMRDDELVVYHGYYLAESELKLYALAYLAGQ